MYLGPGMPRPVLQGRSNKETGWRPASCARSRHVEAPLSDLVAALDQGRRRAEHECQQRCPGKRLFLQPAGEQQLAAAGGERMLA